MPHLSIHLVFWAVFIVLLLASCGFALWKGGPAERAGALLILFFALIWELGRLLPPSLDSVVQLAQLVSDGLTALGLLIIAMRYASLWIGGTLLFQAAQFSLHSFFLVTGREIDMLYHVINNLNFYAILACLVFGSVMSWRERRARPAEPPSLEPAL